MRLMIFILAIACWSCDACRFTDCAPGTDFYFRLEDANHVPVTDFSKVKFKNPEGDEVPLDQNHPDFMYTWVRKSPEETYTLVYDGKSTSLKVRSKLISKKGCCGPTFDIDEVEAGGVKILTESNSSTPPGVVYVIPI